MNNYLKNKIKEVKKQIKKERKQLRNEKRIKSGFYQKLTLVILILSFIFISIQFTLLNRLYDNLIEESKNIHNHSESSLEANFELLEDIIEPTLARITCFGPDGTLTSTGKIPKNGMVATSDRSIPFGTEIIIDGKTYIVETRTNKRIQDEFGMLTIDIFMEEGCDKNFGADKKLIMIK